MIKFMLVKVYSPWTLMNLIKMKQRNTLIDETSIACVSLKTTNYTPDISGFNILKCYLLKNNRNHANK